MPTALVTGITGQDGYYLTRLLIEKGYQVVGMVRNDGPNTARLRADLPDTRLVYGNLCDGGSLLTALNLTQPDEVYNLGAASFVGQSFQAPEATHDVTGTGALRLLEAVRRVDPTIRYYQASSSEQFGRVAETPQTETTPFHPRSPYGCAKVFAHHVTVNYREAYGIHASCGILFNHESPRRGPQFVTRKITSTLAAIKAGRADRLVLGNLDAARDWGYAGDYVHAMWAMLQQDEPDDYVIATGQTHTVKEFVELAGYHLNLDPWPYVHTDPSHLRPAEVDLLCGDATKARQALGWAPTVRFDELVRIMAEAECCNVPACAAVA